MSERYKTRAERKQSAQKPSSSSKKPTRPKGNKADKSSLFKRIMMGLAIFVLACISIGGVAVAIIIQGAPEISAEALESPLSSRIYDVNGNEIAELGAQKRTQVDIENVPDIVKNAFVSTEDVRFYSHFGVDPLRIGGAVIANFQEGFGAEGASTITQQVVKNYLLTSEKKLTRKIQEAWLAVKLEQQYSKDQILELYLNKILFAQDIYGVSKATEFYFDKDITSDEITIEEAALLAGLPQSPNYYNPFRNPEAAEKRRNVVINLMAKNGFITDAEAEKAKAIPVTDTIVKKEDNPQPYDAYIDQVIEEFQKKSDMDLYSSGLKVYTYLNPQAQQVVEESLDTNKYVQYPDAQMQAGVAVVSTQNGGIAAIGGGRNQEVKRGYNYATDINRQPGSTIKPILDYGPAIEYLEWSTYHQMVDEQYTYSDGTPINNWDNRYFGQISMRTALAESRNIPALKAIQEVGLDRAKGFAAGLGIDVGENIYESYSIGGFNGVSPLEMAGAYSAFGNGGVYNEPHTIAKIVFPDGTEKTFDPEPQVAMKESTAFMISDMLKTAVQSGTGTAANVANVPVAGKTGTSNYSDETRSKYGLPNRAVPDSWFSGYSTEYTTAIWTGYPKTTSDFYMDYQSQQIAKQLFRAIMTQISGDQVADFQQPDSVVRVGVEKGSTPARLPSDFTPQSEIVYEYFIRGTEPTVTSQQYFEEEEEEEPVSSVEGLFASYNRESNVIELSWNHADSDNAEFSVDVSVDEGSFQSLTTTDQTEIIVENVIPGGIYGFRVTATVDGESSEPSTTTIELPSDGNSNDDNSDEDNENDGSNGPGQGNNEDGEGNNNGPGNNNPDDGSQDGQGNDQDRPGNDGDSDGRGNEPGPGNGNGNGNEGDQEEPSGNEDEGNDSSDNPDQSNDNPDGESTP
ncbi:penicillin-binding protein 1A [Aureibacillus halotolerans]|uniref:Penicillin-binding protein 1A n=1 Tax=Aureibacillus halotolerans TaxID=1508390 RepID=A0A4R6U948_9BACI|nr:penicillin-binding protein 1A [Aureibacillus halotolerans]TDQ41493.1 penicillin-binding protein 1A [Aureibacillus halotolerans]